MLLMNGLVDRVWASSSWPLHLVLSYRLVFSGLVVPVCLTLVHVCMCVQACVLSFYPCLLSAFPLEALQAQALDASLPLPLRGAVLHLLAQVNGRTHIYKDTYICMSAAAAKDTPHTTPAPPGLTQLTLFPCYEQRPSGLSEAVPLSDVPACGCGVY